ncbi:MAG TPA: DUF998 domain-containing protein [Streptosporangiaceae bacterium]|nr:DUF998 domain-containing protein [Streptosporangiaceae bacterium]
MTRGARQAANADIQTGNGSVPHPSSTTGRGSMGNWIRSGTPIRASARIPAGSRIRTGSRLGQGIRNRTGARIRAGAIAGVTGPAAFTLGWIVAAFRQPGLPFSAPQISGLAAGNARDPWLMMSGFLLLGGCAIGFGAALRAALGGRRAGPAPRLIQLAGLLAIAAGLLRRDHVLLTAGPESWHNEAHNVISAAAYVLLIAAPLLLARRFRNDRQWSRLTVPLAAASVAAAALLAALYAEPASSWAATLQRIGVSLPLAAIVAVAIRLTRLAGATDLTSPGDGDAGGLPGRSGRSRQPE